MPDRASTQYADSEKDVTTAFPGCPSRAARNSGTAVARMKPLSRQGIPPMKADGVSTFST